jgi:hypothetical protein
VVVTTAQVEELLVVVTTSASITNLLTPLLTTITTVHETFNIHRQDKKVLIQIGDLQEQGRLVKAVLLLLFLITEEVARLINKVQVPAIVEALTKVPLVNTHGSQSLTLCWSLERTYLLLE